MCVCVYVYVRTLANRFEAVEAAAFFMLGGRESLAVICQGSLRLLELEGLGSAFHHTVCCDCRGGRGLLYRLSWCPPHCETVLCIAEPSRGCGGRMTADAATFRDTKAPLGASSIPRDLCPRERQQLWW